MIVTDLAVSLSWLASDTRLSSHWPVLQCLISSQRMAACLFFSYGESLTQNSYGEYREYDHLSILFRDRERWGDSHRMSFEGNRFIRQYFVILVVLGIVRRDPAATCSYAGKFTFAVIRTNCWTCRKGAKQAPCTHHAYRLARPIKK